MMISYHKSKFLMLHFKNKKRKEKKKHHVNEVDKDGGNYLGIAHSAWFFSFYFLFVILRSCQMLINLYASSIT